MIDGFKVQIKSSELSKLLQDGVAKSMAVLDKEAPVLLQSLSKINDPVTAQVAGNGIRTWIDKIRTSLLSMQMMASIMERNVETYQLTMDEIFFLKSLESGLYVRKDMPQVFGPDWFDQVGPSTSSPPRQVS